MQRRIFFRALFGGLGAAMTSRHILAGDSTVLIQESPVAGFQFHRGDAVWPSLRVGEKLSLVREVFNDHDRDAVAVTDCDGSGVVCPHSVPARYCGGH